MSDLRRKLIRIIIILIGVGVLAYPSVSQFLMQKNAGRAIADYDETVKNAGDERLEALMEEARQYNRLLASSTGFQKPPTDQYGEPLSLEAAGRIWYNGLSSKGTDYQKAYCYLKQADENAIIIWGAALDEEMEDSISVIVIATGFPTTDSYAPVPGKKEDKKPVSPFQYGNSAVRNDPNRFGAVTRPQDKPQQTNLNKPQQPAYNPFAAQTQPAPQPAAPVYPNANTAYPNANTTYPNANTSAPAASKPAPQPKPAANGDSDDSYMDIISLFNNK